MIPQMTSEWGPRKCFTLALQHSYANWIPASLHQSKELRNINKKRLTDTTMILNFFLFSKCFWFKQMGVSFVPYLENLAMQASSCSVEVDYFSVILFGLTESDFWGHAPTWFFSLQGQKGAVHRAHVLIEVAWPWTTHLLQVLFLEVFAFKASDDKLWLGRVYVFPFFNLCRQT